MLDTVHGGGSIVRVSVPYGRAIQSAEIDAARLAGIVEPAAVEPRVEADVIDAALASPVNGVTVPRFLDRATSLLIVVNDATRPTPTARILRRLSPQLGGLTVTVAVATGAHHAPTEGELRSILGDPPAIDVARVHVHDARDAAAHVRLGRTSAGTPVDIDRIVTDAERVLALSSVEPHYFAGYTGGRKSLVPGLAAFRTIEANHSHAMSDEARPLRLVGNPVHDDMVEAADMVLDRRFHALMTVLDPSGRVSSAAAGDVHGTLAALLPAAESIYAPAVGRKEAVVVAAVSPPLDIDLYQAQKALEHGILALEDGGTLILVSPCHQGIGDDTFAKVLAAAATPEEAAAGVQGPYRFGNHKVARIARAVRRFEIVAVTGLEPGIIESLFMKPAASLQSALDDALAKRPDARVLVMPRAAETVPRVAAS